MKKIICLILCVIMILPTLAGCAVLNNEVTLIKDGEINPNQQQTNPEKQNYYNGYFASKDVGFETLVFTKMGDYSVSTIKTENGNMKVEVQIDKTHKLSSYYIDKAEYVEYINGDKTEWYKTSGKTSFISLVGSDNTTTSVKVDDIKSIKYISSKDGIDTIEIENLKNEKIKMEIRESSKKIIYMSGNGIEMRFSDILEKDDKISFTKPSKFTEKSAQDIQSIIFAVLGA